MRLSHQYKFLCCLIGSSLLPIDCAARGAPPDDVWEVSVAGCDAPFDLGVLPRNLDVRRTVRLVNDRSTQVLYSHMDTWNPAAVFKRGGDRRAAPILPGEFLDIPIQINTRTKRHSLGDWYLNIAFKEPVVHRLHRRINAFVRTDIVCEPSRLEFGTFKEGRAQQRNMAIRFAGRADWKILSATSQSNAVQVELKETKRLLDQKGYAEIEYELSAFVKNNIRQGPLDAEIVVKIDDTVMIREHINEFRVIVDGIIVDAGPDAEHQDATDNSSWHKAE